MNGFFQLWYFKSQTSSLNYAGVHQNAKAISYTPFSSKLHVTVSVEP